MIASRRAPRPARASGETHVPPPSGPRCVIASRMRVTYGPSMSNAPHESAPAMPHTSVRERRKRGQSDPAPDRLGSALARMPVPERNRQRRARVLEQFRNFRDSVGPRAEHGIRSELDRDRSLGRVAKREARHPERRRLLLHATRVGQHKTRAGLEPEELAVSERGSQYDAFERAPGLFEAEA